MYFVQQFLQSFEVRERKTQKERKTDRSREREEDRKKR